MSKMESGLRTRRTWHAVCAGLLLCLATVNDARAAQPAPATWKGSLSIQRCTDERPTIPAQTELALGATLLVDAGPGSGSAATISPDGFALTAAHVVAEHKHVTVQTGGGETYSATVVRVDDAQDIALLKVDAPEEMPCMALSSGTSALGSDVFVLGSPGGEALSFSVAKGVVSGNREFEGARFVQLDASINPGNSGGPLVSPDGLIVGIASWKLSHVTVEGIAFAVPSASAQSALEIEFANASDPDWSTRTGRRSAVAQIVPVGAEAAASGTVSPATRHRLVARQLLITTGAALLATGALDLVIILPLEASEKNPTPKETDAFHGLTIAGATLTAVGAVGIGVGLFIRRTPRRRRRSRPASAAIVPTGSGLAVHGRF